MQLVSVVRAQLAVRLPYRVQTPPPSTPAELPLTVQLVSVVVPSKLPGRRRRRKSTDGVAADGAVGQRSRAAEAGQPAAVRLSAELPLTVQLVSVAVPLVEQAAAVAGGVAADGAVGQRGRAVVVQAAAVP